MPQLMAPLKSIAADQRERGRPGRSAARAGARGQAERAHGCEREERAHHEDFAMGEIDELDDAVDEGVAQRDQGDERPVRHSRE